MRRRSTRTTHAATTISDRPDFFDVENHPTISFESTTIEHVKKGNYRVDGDLTMHGETRPVEVEVTVHGVTRDPQGQDRVGVEVRGTISRGEFGLRWQQALETGGVMVGDEVRVSADCRRSAQAPTWRAWHDICCPLFPSGSGDDP